MLRLPKTESKPGVFGLVKKTSKSNHSVGGHAYVPTALLYVPQDVCFPKLAQNVSTFANIQPIRLWVN